MYIEQNCYVLFPCAYDKGDRVWIEFELSSSIVTKISPTPLQNKTCTNLTLYNIGHNAKQDHNDLNSTLYPFLFYGHLCIITNLAWPELGFRVRSFKGGFNETRPLLISYKSCPHHKLSSIHIDSQLGSNGLLLSVCVFDRSASGWSLIHDQRKGPRQITFSCAGALWISKQRENMFSHRWSIGGISDKGRPFRM